MRSVALVLATLLILPPSAIAGPHLAPLRVGASETVRSSGQTNPEGGAAPAQRAEGTGPTSASPATSAPAASPSVPQSQPAPPPVTIVDGLGRPFPDPKVLGKANGWTGGGAALTGIGAGLLVSGLFLGSALARGEIGTGFSGVRDGGPVDPTAGAVAGMFFGGAISLMIGVPTLSAGTFTRGQLLRTIKGAEKVPRTVANEQRYWNAYLQRQYGQALAVAGGGELLLGVLTIAAVAATVGTEFYDPRMWLTCLAPFGMGSAFLILGLKMQQGADTKMKTIRDEVDTYRAPGAQVALPLPYLARTDGPDPATVGGLALVGTF